MIRKESMARILVVDDQPQILKMLEAMLIQVGHIVTCAVDAYDAIEKVKSQPFEMVITDAVMPGGASGFDLVKTLRSDPALKNMLIILLTGKREKKDVARGIDSGVDDYVVKPLDPDLFMAKVNNLLSKRFTSGTMFTETVVSEPSAYDHRLTMMGISEVGMSFKSSQPFRSGSKLKFESSFFVKVGIEAPSLRVIACETNPNDDYFIVRVQFVGLTESDLKPLRLWIRGQSSIRAA